MGSELGRGRSGRRSLRARTALPSLMLFVVGAAIGCDSFASMHRPGTDAVGAGGSTGASGSPSLPLGGGIILPSTPCQLPATGAAPVFLDRAIRNDAPARRELFTWTTSEQVAEIRAGSVLLTRSEREGLGPGYAADYIAELSFNPAEGPSSETQQLAALLSGPRFEKARYAWTEPWATRMGWPGESYGNQLVRMVLRPEAWLARYRYGGFDVIDMNNQPVALADVLAQPERLAGVYFVRDRAADGPTCAGSFRGGKDGYREFIIGNEAMIEEWSLQTPEIRARIEADIALAQQFLDRIRPCPPGPNSFWNTEVVCSWDGPLDGTEVGAYQASLAIPSSLYFPSAASMAALIETLQGDLFEPDPFVVKPGSVNQGSGGEGAAGGAGGSSGAMQ